MSEVSVGETVEICSEEDGFKGSFYEAKVLAKKAQNKILVKYKTLVIEEDENVFLNEVVDARIVRPTPPDLRVSEFKLLDKVDAYYNDGWWKGKIMKKLGSGYTVHFETTNELLDFPSCCLRPHQDFVDGVWVRPPREKYSVFLDVKLFRCR